MAQGELEQIKARLSRLEEEIFGMTYEDAERVVDSYISAVEENPRIEASESVKKAERLLGV